MRTVKSATGDPSVGGAKRSAAARPLSVGRFRWARWPGQH